MSPKYLHQHAEFKELISITAKDQGVNEPSLVEKDYWIMHVLYGLKKQGFEFQLKGGTSLSKGFGIINRFSEDIDLKIDPPSGQDIKTGKNQDKPKQIESRKKYFEWLADNISIPGIIKIARDQEFDDEKFRSAGIRLNYDSLFETVAGLKSGILLEVGFDKTAPNTKKDISSWAYEKAIQNVDDLIDNRALGIHCYNPEYTFVEKLQAVVNKFRQFEKNGEVGKNFLRHYYDIYKLLEHPKIQSFIGTKAYLKHKKERFKTLEMDLSKTDAFILSADRNFEKFEKEYSRTRVLYYKYFPNFSEVLKRIHCYLEKL